MKLILVPGSCDRERAARAAKATALADILVEYGIDAYDVALMQDDMWQLAAQAAGVRMPSAITRKLVEQLVAHQGDRL